MDTQAILDILTPKQLDYVTYRMGTDADAHAWRKAGYNKKAWFKLNENLRAQMTDAAVSLARDGKLRAIRLYQDEMEGAAGRIVRLSKEADNENVQLKANLDILDRGGMVAKKEIEITSGGNEIGIRTIEVIKDYGTQDDHED